MLDRNKKIAKDLGFTFLTFRCYNHVNQFSTLIKVGRVLCPVSLKVISICVKRMVLHILSRGFFSALNLQVWIWFVDLKVRT